MTDRRREHFKCDMNVRLKSYDGISMTWASSLHAERCVWSSSGMLSKRWDILYKRSMRVSFDMYSTNIDEMNACIKCRQIRRCYLFCDKVLWRNKEASATTDVQHRFFIFNVITFLTDKHKYKHSESIRMVLMFKSNWNIQVSARHRPLIQCNVHFIHTVCIIQHSEQEKQ